MKFAILLMICLFPGLASAASLYRCVGRAGQVSYQSAACATNQRMDRSIEYVPDPVSPPPIAVSTRTTKPPATRKHLRVRDGSGRRRTPRPSPCSLAKAKRVRQLERLGFKRTFDDLSRIDAAVRAVVRFHNCASDENQ